LFTSGSGITGMNVKVEDKFHESSVTRSSLVLNKENNFTLKKKAQSPPTPGKSEN